MLPQVLSKRLVLAVCTSTDSAVMILGWLKLG